MDLDQLRYFLRVAERQSFTKAAADLGISQPALSRSIRKLEEDLGQPVFERQSRAVVLTDAGRLLQTRARQALAVLDDVRVEITDDGRSGCLRIGAIPTVAPYFLPDVLRRFTNAFPDASVVVREQTTDRLLKACGDGEIDLAILALPVSAPYLDVETLFEEELLLVMPPSHPLAARPAIRIADIEPLRAAVAAAQLGRATRPTVSPTRSSRSANNGHSSRWRWSERANWRPCRSSCRWRMACR